MLFGLLLIWEIIHPWFTFRLKIISQELCQKMEQMVKKIIAALGGSRESSSHPRRRRRRDQIVRRLRG